jgi:hypothetical protein
MMRKLMAAKVDPNPSFKVGSDIRISRAGLDAWLERRMAAAQPLSHDAALADIRASRR